MHQYRTLVGQQRFISGLIIPSTPFEHELSFASLSKRAADPQNFWRLLNTDASPSISGLSWKRATANPFTRASCYSWSSKGHTWLHFDRKSGAYHTSFNHQRSTKSLSQTQKCMLIKWRDVMARTWKHIFHHVHFRAKYMGFFFFERRYQPLFARGFISNQRKSICWCPKSPFLSKTQNRLRALTSPFSRGWRIGACS